MIKSPVVVVVFVYKSDNQITCVAVEFWVICNHAVFIVAWKHFLGILLNFFLIVSEFLKLASSTGNFFFLTFNYAGTIQKKFHEDIDIPL